MTKRKVMIVGGGFQYEKMFQSRGWEVVYSLGDADLIQFTGGADVNPELYGEMPHPTTHRDTLRDEREQSLYVRAVEQDKPMAGICRGSQFLNVMNGGTLYQDVDGHATGHKHIVADLDRAKIIQVTSTHHQMMRPTKEARVLAIARIATYKEYMKGGYATRQTEKEDDIEAVWYERTRCLCYQPHPEFEPGPCQDYYFELLERYVYGQG